MGEELEPQGSPDVLAPVPEVHGEIVPPAISTKVPGYEARFPVRPADRPDQRLDPRFRQALLKIEVSGGVADEWVNHSPLLSTCIVPQVIRLS